MTIEIISWRSELDFDFGQLYERAYNIVFGAFIFTRNYKVRVDA